MSLTAERSVSSQKPGRREIIVEFSPEELKAPFVLRCGSLLIDYVVLIMVPVITLLLSESFGGATTSRTGGVSNSTGWLIGSLICLTNFLILPSLNGQTIGKMLTGLRIVKVNGTPVSLGTVVLRHSLGYFLTFITLGLGFMIAAVNKSGRALHDFVAGTTVVYAKRRTL